MNYSYDMFSVDINSLIHQIMSKGDPVDYIVGIVRGGSIPAVCLSHRLEVPMRNVSWSTFHPDQMKEHAWDIAEDVYEGKRILLVDDIVDSGRTIMELIEDWECTREQIKIASLIYNIDQPIKPDFYARTIDRKTNKDWVHFWWEKEVG